MSLKNNVTKSKDKPNDESDADLLFDFPDLFDSNNSNTNTEEQEKQIQIKSSLIKKEEIGGVDEKNCPKKDSDISFQEKSYKNEISPDSEDYFEQNKIKNENIKIYNYKEIKEYIIIILRQINEICNIKLYNKYESFNKIVNSVQQLPENIVTVIPYIMDIDDYDDIKKYYSYIINIYKYYIIKLSKSKVELKLKYSRIIDIIHIVDILILIIENNNNALEKNSVKFYIYHLINCFSDNKNKIENANLFFKSGINILLNEFPNEKLKFTKNFPDCFKLECLQEFLTIIFDISIDVKNEIQKININNEYIKEFNNSSSIVENLLIIKNNLNTGDLQNKNNDGQYKQESNNLNMINLNKKDSKYNDTNNTMETIELLVKELRQLSFLLFPIFIKNTLFNFYFNLVINVITIIEGRKDYDFFYPLYFINIKSINLVYLKKYSSKNMNIYQQLDNNIDTNFITKAENYIKYFLKFEKYDYFESILNGNNKEIVNLKSDFIDILKEQKFQEKVYNFFISDNLKEFLEITINEPLLKRIKNGYINFMKYIQSNKFWNSIMLYTLPRYTKGFTQNYLRIIINDHYIIFNNANKNDEKEKKLLLRFCLFSIIIHEILHLMRRYFLTKINSKVAITPPSSMEKKDIKENSLNEIKEENIITNDCSNKNEKNEKENDNIDSGEIGEELINFFFGTRVIREISIKQAKIFEELNFKKNEDFIKLKNINKYFRIKEPNITLMNSSSDISSGYIILGGDCFFAIERGLSIYS